MEVIAFINHFKQSYQLQFKNLAKKYTLSMIEIHILLFLKNNPDKNSAKEIVKLRGLAKSNVSNALEKLRSRNLLAIEIDATNRRQQHIRLLPDSKPIVNALHKKQQEFIDSLKEGFNEEELDQMEQYLMRWHQNIIKMIEAEKEV